MAAPTFSRMARCVVGREKPCRTGGRRLIGIIVKSFVTSNSSLSLRPHLLPRAARRLRLPPASANGPTGSL